MPLLLPSRLSYYGLTSRMRMATLPALLTDLEKAYDAVISKAITDVRRHQAAAKKYNIVDLDLQNGLLELLGLQEAVSIGIQTRIEGNAELDYDGMFSLLERTLQSKSARLALMNAPFTATHYDKAIRLAEDVIPRLRDATTAFEALAALRNTLASETRDRGARQVATRVDVHLGGLRDSNLQGVVDASELVHELRRNLMRALSGPGDLDDVRPLLPEQKVAPVRFDIRDERIVIAEEEADPGDRDRLNASVAREELIRSGEELLASLRQSNCDRRVVVVVEYLQSQLVSNENIVRVAMANLRAEHLVPAYEDELATPVAMAWRSHCRAVAMYAAQFPDWQRFVENDAVVQIERDDVSKIRDTVSAMVVELEKKPEAADPEVPKTLKFLNELLVDPNKASKRAAFAVLRSVENLISKAWSFSIDTIVKTATEAQTKVVKATSAALAVVILGLALNGAGGIAPVASKIQDMQWLLDAKVAVAKHLKKIKAGD